MGSKTGIQWTDCTDNVITVKGGGWWCRRISEGCDNCYAAALNQNSFYGGNKLDYSGQPPELVLKSDLIESWARQRKPKKHFVSSMTDVFGEWVPLTWHFEILDGMAAAPSQIFQLLTKRPDIMFQAIDEWLERNNREELPSNIWVGSTIEKQKHVQTRLPYLIKIPAHIKFVSCEPLLEEVRLNVRSNSLTDQFGEPSVCECFINHLDWVIIGGESGSNARPFNLDWAQSLINQCRNSATSVAPFLKQLGSNPVSSKPYIAGVVEVNYQIDLKSPKGSDPAEWPDSLQVQEFPLVAIVRQSLLTNN